jgi:hypothetical protein
VAQHSQEESGGKSIVELSTVFAVVAEWPIPRGACTVMHQL